MNLDMAERYEAEMIPPPAGLNPPVQFWYIHFKAFSYLKMGTDAYRANDALGMPPENTLPTILAVIEQGCRQIVDWRGITQERPLQELGINGFYRLIELFHFVIADQIATFGDNGNVMDKMTIRHGVTGEEITLFNLVNKG